MERSAGAHCKKSDSIQRRQVGRFSGAYVITDLISIYTAKIYIEKKKPEPDLKLIESYSTEQTRLRRERTALNLLDDSAVALVRSKYSPVVRSMREEHREEWSKLV